MKLLKLRIHPWWFHFPISSCLNLQESGKRKVRRRTIKLIKSDGMVKIYDRPIHVSDLLMEFPKHLVCRSDSFYIGQKIPALSGTEKLQLGHNYFLLPNHYFQTVLSFVTVASFASRNAPLRIKAAAASCTQAFDIQRSPSGCSRIRISDEFISRLIQEDEEEERGSGGVGVGVGVGGISSSKVCTTPQLHKDYTQLVGLRRWKPKLDTIKEREKKKNKLLSQKLHKSNVITSSSSSSSSSTSKSSKIKIKSRKMIHWMR